MNTILRHYYAKWKKSYKTANISRFCLYKAPRRVQFKMYNCSFLFLYYVKYLSLDTHKACGWRDVSQNKVLVVQSWPPEFSSHTDIHKRGKSCTCNPRAALLGDERISKSSKETHPGTGSSGQDRLCLEHNGNKSWYSRLSSDIHTRIYIVI